MTRNLKGESTLNLRYVAACATAALALTACAGSYEASKPAAAPGTTPSSTSTVAPMSVSQVASVIAEAKPRLVKLQEGLSRCPATGDIEKMTCALVAERSHTEGDLLVKAMTPLAGSRVPAELQPLFTDTLASAERMQYFQVAMCSADAQSPDCAGEVLQATVYTNNLMNKIAGWDPYL